MDKLRAPRPPTCQGRHRRSANRAIPLAARRTARQPLRAGTENAGAGVGQTLTEALGGDAGGVSCASTMGCCPPKALSHRRRNSFGLLASGLVFSFELQGCVLHVLVSSFGQLFPPPSGKLIITGLLVLVPPPQVAEHFVQSDHTYLQSFEQGCALHTRASDGGAGCIPSALLLAIAETDIIESTVIARVKSFLFIGRTLI